MVQDSEEDSAADSAADSAVLDSTNLANVRPEEESARVIKATVAASSEARTDPLTPLAALIGPLTRLAAAITARLVSTTSTAPGPKSVAMRNFDAAPSQCCAANPAASSRPTEDPTNEL